MAKNPIPFSCGTCAHWHPAIPDSAIGECRRYPPVLVDMNQRLKGRFPEIALRTLSPVTPADALCGEFKAAR